MANNLTPLSESPFPDDKQPSGEAVTAPKTHKLIPLEEDPFSEMPSGEDVKGTIGAVTGQVAPAIKQARQDIETHIHQLRGMSPDVDYNTGLGFLVQHEFEQADNPKEAGLVLSRHFGTGDITSDAHNGIIGQDKGGRWWVTKDGKKISVYGGGQGVKTAFEKTGVGMAASLPESLGATLGGLAGVGAAPVTGGLSIPAGIAGGYLLGKGATETIKYFQGLYAKTPDELTKTLLEGTEANLLLNMLPEVAGNTAKSALNWLRTSWMGATKEGMSIANRLLDLGARPPIASVAPKAKVFQYEQLQRNLISGSPTEGRNVAVIQDQMRKILSTEGVPKAEADELLKAAGQETAAIYPKGVGEAATSAAIQHVANLQAGANADLAAAKASANRSIKIFETLASKAEPIGSDVKAALQSSRQATSRAMNRVYNYVDELTNSEKIVPWNVVKWKVQEISRGMNPTTVPYIFNRIADMPDKVSIMEAHSARSELRSLAMGTDLTPSISKHYLNEAASIADSAIKFLKFDPAAAIPEASINAAKSLMTKADAMYGEEISKYHDAVVNKLVNQLKARMQPDAATTADIILSEGYTERARTIIKMLPPELKPKVASAATNMILRDAEKLAPTLDFEIRGSALLNVLNNRGDVLNEVYSPVYGKSFFPRLQAAAKDLAAVGGTLGTKDITARLPTLMESGEIFNYLSNRLAKINTMDSFVKDNFLGALVSKDPSVVDRAYYIIVQPGKEAMLSAANNFFGPGSETMMSVRKFALHHALSEAIVKLPSAATTIAGTEMDRALAQYTKEQQKILFPAGLSEDLRLVANEARFLFPWMTKSGEQDFGASLRAAEIKAHVPFSLKYDILWLKSQFFGWIADRETTVRAIAAGFRGPTAAGSAARKTFQTAFNTYINSIMGGPGNKKISAPMPPPVPPQQQ